MKSQAVARRPTSTNQVDPSRTFTLRRQFCSELLKRFKAIRQKVFNLIMVEDAFGLKETRPVFNVRWKFNTSAEKMEAFRVWLAEQIQSEMIPHDASNIDGLWWNRFVEEGYRKGAGRAFDETRKPYLNLDKNGNVSDFYKGTRAEFLKSSFGQPETVEKIQALSSRVFTDLKGVTDYMSQQMTRSLAEGLAQGQGPRDIARQMIKQVDMSYNRAETIAQTEILRAHNEGTLDSLEKLGVTHIGVMVEWDTAGDGRVCKVCSAMQGVVLTVKEARGMFPRHPRCRCVPVPANVGESQKDQIRGKGNIDEAIDESIKREIPPTSKRTIAEQKARTSWVGADKTITKTRPRMPVLPQDSKRSERSLTTKVAKPIAVPEKKSPYQAAKDEYAAKQEEYKKPLVRFDELNREMQSGQGNLSHSEYAQKFLELYQEYATLQPEAARMIANLKRLREEVDKLKPTIESRLRDADPALEKIRQNVLKAQDSGLGKVFGDLAERKKIQDQMTTVANEMTNLENQFADGKISRARLARETDRLVREYTDLEGQKEETVKRIAKLNQESKSKQFEAIQVEKDKRVEFKSFNSQPMATTDSNGNPIFTVPLTDEYKTKAKEALEFLTKLTAKAGDVSQIEVRFHRLPDGGRAFQRAKETSVGRSDRGVYMNNTDSKSTHIHEIGHKIERSVPEGVQLAEDFRLMRIAKAGTKDVKLDDQFPGYGFQNDEIGNEDGFGKLMGAGSTRSFYAGKGYGGGATELVSLGLEKLYEDPANFARVDPEYFKFLIGLLQGLL